MLILTRREGDEVTLRDSRTGRTIALIKVVTFLPNGIVRLGIEADPTVSIIRDNMRKDQYGNDQKDE